MTEEEVEAMRLWATSVMAWERAEAKVHGKKIKPIKGIKKLNEDIMLALSEHRITLAIQRLETTIRVAYKMPRKEFA